MTGTTLPSAAAAPQQVPTVVPAVAPLASDNSRHHRRSRGGPPRGSRRLDDSPLPAFLVSTIIHTLLLLLLAMFTYRVRGVEGDFLLVRQGPAATGLALQSIESRDRQQRSEGALVEQPIPVTIAPTEPLAVASPLRNVNSDGVDPAVGQLAGGDASGDAPLVRLPAGGLDGRSAEGRLEYGRKYGATIESERAVDAALEWLAAHQRGDGSWSFDLSLDPCGGRCRHSKRQGSGTPTPATGATGLALLAFLSAGHTHHHDGPYQETVRRGIYYLRAAAAQAQAGYDWQQGSMYGHGIALMALAEALSMTRNGDRGDADLVELVAGGASFSCVAQHRSGSWGYVPGSPGDITVTGWQVLSLIAAKRSGAMLHTNTLRDARSFVMSTCTEGDYWFGYKGPPGEPTTTAIGLTLMLYLGQSPAYTPFYLALTEMAERGPSRTNIYHDYYATLALHHSRHRDWDRWNQQLRDHLVATQEKSGHEKGSWHFPDRWGDIGGRLYTTAMATMTLQIYYRYQPLYESLDDFPL